jgi:NADH:ubiquinone oxidoreductase subunit 4 (subunit M)
MAALLALSLPLAQDAAEEGKKIITAMLIVGLVFLAVIALGQLSYWFRHRR